MAHYATVIQKTGSTSCIATPTEEDRATLSIQYNRDWGTSYSRPPIDPYLTSPLLQNPGGAIAQCYLPPGCGDIPALTPAKAGT